MFRHLPHRLRHAIWAPLLLLTVVSLAPPRINASIRLAARAGGTPTLRRFDFPPSRLAGGAVASLSAAEASKPMGLRASRLLHWGSDLCSASPVRLACLWAPFVRLAVRPDPPHEQQAKEEQMHDASLFGRLSRDPELVTTPRGIVSADLQAAVDRRGGGAVLASPRGLEEQAKGLQRTPHRHLAAAQARRMGTDHGSKRFQLYVVPQAVQFIGGGPDDRHEQRPIPDGRQDVG